MAINGTNTIKKLCIQSKITNFSDANEVSCLQFLRRLIYYAFFFRILSVPAIFTSKNVNFNRQEMYAFTIILTRKC